MGDHEDFFTVPNLKRCKRIFKEYMRDFYNVDVTEKDADLRKFLFEIMTDVEKEYGTNPSITTKEMNNLTIKIARDMYLSDHGGAEQEEDEEYEAGDTGVARAALGSTSTKVQARPLDRDHQIYGNRRVPFNDRPTMANVVEPDVSLENSYERMMAERAANTFDPNRDMPMRKLPDTALEMDPRLTEEECLNQLNEIQMYRDRDDAVYFANARSATDTAKSAGASSSGDPSMSPALIDGDEHAINPASKSSFNGPDAVKRSDFVIDDAKVTKSTYLKNLSINGFDRDWISDPHRYRYTVRTANSGMHTSFRDIVAIQATCIILPMEIVQTSQSTATAYIEDKPTFQYDFGLSYPYLILAIEGFEGVYDGTNDIVRKAFAKFVYSKQYKTTNGRGYVVLEPMQDEIKRFEPAPLASLRNLTLTVQRPNGLLFNESKDDYLVTKVEYESFNEFFLKIVLDKYFDRNEFHKGDTVTFQSVKFAGTDGLNKPSGFALSLLEDFLNRKEGHEIIQMEPTNESGFRQAFSIYAPGTVDQKLGRVIINNSMIKALIKHNEEITEDDTKTTGNVLNASLQNVISMRVWMNRADIMPALGFSRSDRTNISL